MNALTSPSNTHTHFHHHKLTTPPSLCFVSPSPTSEGCLRFSHYRGSIRADTCMGGIWRLLENKCLSLIGIIYGSTTQNTESKGYCVKVFPTWSQDVKKKPASKRTARKHIKLKKPNYSTNPKKDILINYHTTMQQYQPFTINLSPCTKDNPKPNPYKPLCM